MVLKQRKMAHINLVKTAYNKGFNKITQLQLSNSWQIMHRDLTLSLFNPIQIGRDYLISFVSMATKHILAFHTELL